MGKRSRPPTRLTPPRRRKHARLLEPGVGTSGKHVAFRWQRFSRATSDLVCEFVSLIVRGLTSILLREPRRDMAGQPIEDPNPRRSYILSSVILWAFLIAIPVGIYFGISPVRRVVNATAGAACQAIGREVHPADFDKSASSDERNSGEIIKTVLPQEDRGEILAPMLDWLCGSRPRMSLKKGLDSLEILDYIVTREVERLVDRDTDGKGFGDEESPLTVRTTCEAGEPDNPWLILALGEGTISSVGYSFAIRRESGGLRQQLLNEDIRSEKQSDVIERGKPWIAAVDLDGDGCTEIVHTWSYEPNSELSVQVHKLVPGQGWKRVMSLDHLFLGQVRIDHADGKNPVRLVVASGVAPKKKQLRGEIVTYLVSVYQWDNKRGTLKKTAQYKSDKEFDPSEVFGRYVTNYKTLPPPIRSTLNKHFEDGWLCTSAKSIYGYQILSLIDSDQPERGFSQWILVIDPKNRIVLADCGASYAPVELSDVRDLDGDGKLDAVIEANGGGAHGNATYYLCSFSPSFRVMGAIHTGRGSIREIKDLNGDGRQEIVISDACFDQFDCIACSETPFLTMVLGYRGSRYVDVTREFRDIVRADMDAAASELCSMTMSERLEWDWPDSAWESLAIQWLANAAVLGEEDAAYNRIRKLFSGDRDDWITRQKAAIISVVRTRSEQLSYEAPIDLLD